MPRYNRELDLNDLRHELPGLDAEQGIQRIKSIFRQTSQPTPQAPSSPAVARPSIAANMPMPGNSGLIPLTPATMPSIIDAMARPTLPDVLSTSHMSQDPPQS